MQISFEEVKTIVPQKFPFLMVDKVLSLERGRKAVAIKNVSGNEIHFLGHFPSMAIMPGALILEGMAQTAIILFRKSYEDGSALLQDPNSLFFFGAANARFLRPVVPGDQLQFEVTITKAISLGAVVEGVATVGGQKVAKAELTFGVKKREEMQGRFSVT